MHTIEANIFNKNLTKLLVPSYITYAHTLNDAKGGHKMAALIKQIMKTKQELSFRQKRNDLTSISFDKDKCFF